MKIKIILPVLLVSLIGGCGVTPKKTSPLVVKVPTDYGIQLTSFADVSKQTASYNYNISNVSREMRRLEISHSALQGKKQSLDIETGASRNLVLNEKLQKRQLSPNTYMITIRPYLMAPTRNEGIYRPMLSKYDVNIKIKMPDNARVLKSTVPFERTTGNILEWEVRGIAIVPPVDVWYTVSEDQIDIQSEVNTEGGRAQVTIEVKNNTNRVLGNVLLKTRVPSILYRVLQDESDGQFTLRQDVMYIWNAKIDSIGPRETRTLNIVMEKINPRLPLKNLEIRAYNNRNELIALEQTIQAAPFFSE